MGPKVASPIPSSHNGQNNSLPTHRQGSSRSSQAYLPQCQTAPSKYLALSPSQQTAAQPTPIPLAPCSSAACCWGRSHGSVSLPIYGRGSRLAAGCEWKKSSETATTTAGSSGALGPLQRCATAPAAAVAQRFPHNQHCHAVFPMPKPVAQRNASLARLRTSRRKPRRWSGERAGIRE